MIMKRSGADLSKPYMRSISFTSSGSRPCAPRYCEPATATSPPPPEMRPVAPPEAASKPSSLAIICSTGPPGAAWMMMKLISRMPNRVGTISSRRRRI
jgi:hypothetical protein